VKVTVNLSSPQAAAGFRCSIDGKPYRPCGPKLTVSLKRGKHTISAVAIGADGSAGATPATITVRVVKKKTPRPKHPASS
jgi:hypothetical protein